MKRILICGDRYWEDAATIAAYLESFARSAPVIVHGAARGADYIAGELARGLGLSVEEYPADWNKHGKAAGPIRNRQMLDTGPDLVLAFHDNLAESKGTRDCVEEARRRGISTTVVQSRHPRSAERDALRRTRERSEG